MKKTKGGGYKQISQICLEFIIMLYMSRKMGFSFTTVSYIKDGLALVA